MKKETYLLGLATLLISFHINIFLYVVIFYYGYTNSLDFTSSMLKLVGFGSNGVVFVFITAICYIFGVINLIISFFLKEDEDDYIDEDEYIDDYEYENREV